MWAYRATADGALVLADVEAEERVANTSLDAKVLEHVPPAPFTTTASPLGELVFGTKGGRQTAKARAALHRLVATGQVIVNTKGDRWSTPEPQP